MRSVIPARIAELLKLQTIRRLFLVLRRDVVTVLTFRTLKNNVVSCHNASTAKLNYNSTIAPVASSRRLERPQSRHLNRYAEWPYSITSEIVPAPTVRPPSLIANLNPFSIAIGVINSISNCELSPGITISTPSANVATPVTSVVRK